jgi:hypothetical protein
MRIHILTTTIFLCLTINSFSQKVIEKKVEVNGNNVEMKLDFANNIKIEAWTKNYIEVKVDVNIDKNIYNDNYSLDIEKDGSLVKIIENVDINAIKKAKKENGDKDINSLNAELNYTLKVPAELTYSLKTISGKIEITNCVGEMNINTVSGFIDYSVPAKQKANLKLSTVSGEVYSDLKFDDEPSQKVSWVGTNKNLNLNGGGAEISLKSVSGDIYLRKN